jgi:hypothetical protein
MGCRILLGTERGTGSQEKAVFFCSTTDIAFGPAMDSLEEAEEFIKWLDQLPAWRHGTASNRPSTDPRSWRVHDLMELYNEFRHERDSAAAALLEEDEEA